MTHLQTSDGVRIAYATGGDGPPLVYVRGWISHLDILWQEPRYRQFFETLATRFRVTRYDARGNGLSDWFVRQVTLDHLVLDLEAVVEQLCTGPVVLYGSAFGGPIAATFAARHPDRVSHLILDGTYAIGSRITSRGRQVFVQTMLRTFPEAVFLVLAYATNPTESVVYRNPDIVRQMIAPAMAARLYGLAFRTDIRSLLPSIRVPTLVLHRTESRAIPVQLGRELAAAIPEARYVEMPGVAHNPWEGDVGKTLDAVADHLGVTWSMAETVSRYAGQLVASRYQIVREIGRGAHGTVFRAVDTKLQRDVAVKVLASDTDDAQARARFQREAAIAARLTHPHICLVFDSGEWSGRPFLVMELLEGATLQDAIKERVPGAALILDWSLQLLDGLAAAHAQTVLHRDLKPSNIFLTSGGSIKLLDFGVAKEWDRSRRMTTLETLTRPGAAVGTWAYMAPEQLRGLAVDHRADLFSIGAVLYEICTGRQPFAATSVAETIDRVLYETPVPPHDVDAAVPAALGTVIMKALAKEPSERYQSAMEMLDDLKAMKRPVA